MKILVSRFIIRLSFQARSCHQHRTWSSRHWAHMPKHEETLLQRSIREVSNDKLPHQHPGNEGDELRRQRSAYMSDGHRVP